MGAATVLTLGGLALGGGAAAAEQPQWLSAYASATQAGPAGKIGAAPAPGDDHVDTEHIFGFTMGSDIGAKGEIELEIENVGLFGKRSGSYFATSTLNLMKFTLTDSFRIAPAVAWGSNRIRNVAGFDDHQQVSVQGGAVELRYKVLDREVMPFGLTLHAQPGWNRVDEATGRRVEQYGSEFAALMDKEFIKDRLWGAVNLWYGAGASKDLVAREWSHDSDVAIHVALSGRVAPVLVVGAEMRYLRAYEGMGLDRLKGEALYLGPTFSWHIAKNAGLSGTVNVQVAGKAIDDPRSLDLANFERVQALLRFNLLF
ncbi:hypothetical protein CH341_09025 [Rhodoplanes roseus]|uniref:Uncharacterized protein n=1 Tax=Rhodoplanes roseus TaxID=29409 RepID=A0A327L9R5_9BRAD|nr:hypothetical protein CH341_09025 [Rhodoplanes roseus]